MRTCLLALIIACPLMAQPVDVAGVVAQVKAMRNAREGSGLLGNVVPACDAAKALNEDCAEAFDWYGMSRQVDTKPETLSSVSLLIHRH